MIRPFERGSGPDLPFERAQVEIGPRLWLDADLGLYLAGVSALVVADLHWGFSSSHALAGNLLPLWGNEAIEARLRRLLDRYAPRRMVWLGDSIHRSGIAKEAEEFLDSLGSDLIVTIVGGNHDRHWSRVTANELFLEGYYLHHGDLLADVPSGMLEITGHWHPAITWRDGAGLCLKLPALVESPSRLILPAFSPWAVSTDWHLAAKERLWSISPYRIFPVPPRVAGPNPGLMGGVEGGLKQIFEAGSRPQGCT
jgi:metallophosphoesterase superfamily enzyme